MTSLIDARRAACEERLGTLRDRVATIAELTGQAELCMYVTGSYGRLEASEHSDLDLFFVHSGSSAAHRVSGIQETLIRADLIRLCAELGFPAFSKDGRYLEIHYLNDIKEALGSPDDDYKNFFTARL